MKYKIKCCSVFISAAVLVIILAGITIAGFDIQSGPDQNRAQALVILISFIVLALGISGLCSVAEAVLLSITPSYIAGLRKKKPHRAEKLRSLRQTRVDRSLAAILTMNTVAHTVGAIEAGAQSAIVFGSSWVGIFSAFMTLMILFLSEIIPKTLGAIYWKKLVGATIVYIRVLIYLLYPLVLASEVVTKLISRGKSTHKFNREEFIALAGLGEQTGDIDTHESKILSNLFRFRSLKVTDIMTPRTVIFALPQDASVSEALEATIDNPFSRLPLYGEDIDDITGFVLKDELLTNKFQGKKDVKLSAFQRKMLTVPMSIFLPRLLETMLNNRQHMAVVVDEYGGTKGVVTLEDIIETLLGMEIIDEMDSVANMREMARQQWLKRAKALGLEMEKKKFQKEKKNTGEQ